MKKIVVWYNFSEKTSTFTRAASGNALPGRPATKNAEALAGSLPTLRAKGFFFTNRTAENSCKPCALSVKKVQPGGQPGRHWAKYRN